MDSLILSSEDLQALLLLSRTPGIRTHGLLQQMGAGTEDDFEKRGQAGSLACLAGRRACPLFLGKSPSEILEWIESGANPAWKESLEATRRIFDPEKEISRCEALGIELIPFGDTKYPTLLKETSDPPFLLYCRGALIESDQAALAIVGSRHPSLYGLEQAKRFGRKLSEWGLTVVSGFAKGIDRAGHEGALEVSYGRTIAVLGSGLDVIYPREHKALYEEIAERGALVSEFALGTQPFAENFPKRNRIIAGLALGVLVVEAHSRSGSLITARLATEEGREVFALPGRVDQLGSRGTNGLLKEGAALAEYPEEILDALSPQLWPVVSHLRREGPLPPARSEARNEEENEFLKYFRPHPLSLDEFVNQTKLPVASVTAVLTRLELEGTVQKRLDGRYERR